MILKSKGPVHLSRGVRVSVHSSWISHLLFADDCIIFSEALQRGAVRLKEIMETYNRGLGQLINRDKSAGFFSKNSTDDMKEEVNNVMEIQNETLAEKYLGSPTALGRSTKEAFEYMPTRIKGLVGSSTGRQASCAGREILIKSNAQAVPTYPMSCFLLPAATAKKMRSTISNY